MRQARPRLKRFLSSAMLAVLMTALLAPIEGSEASAFIWPFVQAKQERTAPAASSASAPGTGSEASAAQGLSLRRAFELALANAEVIAIEQEKLKEVEARFYTALDEVTPDIAYQLSEFWQDTPKKGEESGGSSDGASSNLQRRTRPEAKVTFSQSLFKGFKEIAAINASGADKKRQAALLRQAKLLLFLEVSEAFHNLQEARQNLVMLGEMRATLERRVKDLEDRVALGRSRQSEVETSRADLRLIEADAAEEKRLESVSRQLLEFYTGLESVGVLDGSFPDLVIDPDPTAYADKAAVRADVTAAEESMKLAREDVTAARSEFLPSGTVDGNYYTRRVGFQSGTDWDLTWKLDVPVFEGTGPLGELKAAEARRRQAELEYQRAGRFARTQIRNAYEDLVAWIAQEKALRAARDASKENYRIQNEEYALSLVNNLQVLDAFRQSQDVSLRWSRAYHEVKRKYWEFRAAQGESVL
jgi:outer membrane protein TolC